MEFLVVLLLVELVGLLLLIQVARVVLLRLDHPLVHLREEVLPYYSGVLSKFYV